MIEITAEVRAAIDRAAGDVRASHICLITFYQFPVICVHRLLRHLPVKPR